MNKVDLELPSRVLIIYMNGALMIKLSLEPIKAICLLNGCQLDNMTCHEVSSLLKGRIFCVKNKLIVISNTEHKNVNSINFCLLEVLTSSFKDMVS